MSSSSPASPTQSQTGNALSGIRVLNFAQVWAGPVFGHALADFGAEVIKVESTHHVDLMRRYLPMAKGYDDLNIYSLSTFRNQLSVTLNLREPEAQELVSKLVEISDIVGENFRPGVMEQLGLGYEQLKRHNSKLVMISFSTVGQDGPHRHVLAYGMTVSAMAGQENLQGYLSEECRAMGIPISDPIAGVMAAQMALAGVIHARQTDEGCYIDFSHLESFVSLLSLPLIRFQLTGQEPTPAGNRDEGMCPHGVYQCQGNDAWVALAIRNDDEWARLVRALDLQDLAGPRTATLSARLAARDEIDQSLASRVRDLDARDICGRLQEHGIAATPVLSAPGAFTDPYFNSRGSWLEVRNPQNRQNKHTIYGMPWHLSRTPPKLHRHAPSLGEHNEYVFRELLGLTKTKYNSLKRRGVIA